jgi:hypothetical protein
VAHKSNLTSTPGQGFAPMAAHPSSSPLFRFRNILLLNVVQPIDCDAYLPSKLEPGRSHVITSGILCSYPTAKPRWAYEPEGYL